MKIREPCRETARILRISDVQVGQAFVICSGHGREYLYVRHGRDGDAGNTSVTRIARREEGCKKWEAVEWIFPNLRLNSEILAIYPDIEIDLGKSQVPRDQP